MQSLGLPSYINNIAVAVLQKDKNNDELQQNCALSAAKMKERLTDFLPLPMDHFVKRYFLTVNTKYKGK